MIRLNNKGQKQKTGNFFHLYRNKTTPDLASKSLTLTPRNRSGQEEMVGFALIAIIVSVGLLILLSFLIKSPTKGTTESYQIDSFIQASLQYTTDCENEIQFLNLQDLIISCNSGESCIDGRASCDVLNSTFAGIVENSWNAGNQSAIKGYELKVSADGQDKLTIDKGNKTAEYQGGFQDFARSGQDYEVSLTVYS